MKKFLMFCVNLPDDSNASIFARVSALILLFLILCFGMMVVLLVGFRIIMLNPIIMLGIIPIMVYSVYKEYRGK